MPSLLSASFSYSSPWSLFFRFCLPPPWLPELLPSLPLFWFFSLCLLWSPLSLYQNFRQSQLIRWKETFLMIVVISERKKKINQLKQEIVLFWEMDIQATAASSFLLCLCNSFGSNTDLHYFRIRTEGVDSKRKQLNHLLIKCIWVKWELLREIFFKYFSLHVNARRICYWARSLCHHQQLFITATV